MTFGQWPLRVIEDDRVPFGSAVIMSPHAPGFVYGPPEPPANTAAWTAGAVAYGSREDAEAGLRREAAADPGRDHVWLIRTSWGDVLRVSARATALPKLNPRAMIIEGIV